jgi:hypothetical protein
MLKNSWTLAVSIAINISMKLCFVSVNGPRETYFVDKICSTNYEISHISIFFIFLLCSLICPNMFTLFSNTITVLPSWLKKNFHTHTKQQQNSSESHQRPTELFSGKSPSRRQLRHCYRCCHWQCFSAPYRQCWRKSQSCVDVTECLTNAFLFWSGFLGKLKNRNFLKIHKCYYYIQSLLAEITV